MTEEKSIDLVALREQLQVVRQEGENIVLSDKADRAIGLLKLYESQIDIAIKIVKNIIPETLAPFNAKTVRGKYCTISVGKPRGTSAYYVDEEGSEYLKQRITNIPDVEKIEAYIESRGQLPIGVHKNEPKPVVSIRAKGLEDA